MHFLYCLVAVGAIILPALAAPVGNIERDVALQGNSNILTNKVNIAISTNKIIFVPVNKGGTTTITPTVTQVVNTVTLTSTAQTNTVMQTLFTSATTTVTRSAIFTPVSPSATQSTTSAPAVTTASGGNNGTPINAVYYPDWIASKLPPSAVDYTLFDIIYFSFAIPDSNNGLYFTQDNSGAILTDLINRAHVYGKKVCITIGGWTGSQYFSNSVNSDYNRQTFANNIAAMVSQYGADGVDLDWEYPNQAGADQNIINSADSANLLTFLQILRNKLGNDKVISLATPLNVWYGSNGQPMTDVSAYAQYIDHVLLMNYDVWGATNAPNAPLQVCDGVTSWQPNANAKGGVAAWTAAGMPANKIMLGIPSYGYVANSAATTLNHRRSLFGSMEFARKKALARRLASPDNSLTKRAPQLAAFVGQSVEFQGMIDSGALVRVAGNKWTGGMGYTFAWDQCSQTPYLYNTAASVVASFDTNDSIWQKADFARSQGLRGLGMWDISGDTDDWVLTKAARAGLQI